MPGRLTVGQMALNHLIHVRIVAGQQIISMQYKKHISPKILIAGAMDTELLPLFKSLGKAKTHKLLNTFPLSKMSYKSLELFILKTYVGDVNASIAGFEAVRETNPDYVIKFGAVGGSYPESKAGDIIVPLGFFHRTSWITRNKMTQQPSNNASKWESVFGELPYQVNSSNLGGIPYYFPVPKHTKIMRKDTSKVRYEIRHNLCRWW